MSDTIVDRVWLFCPVYFDVEAFLVLRSKLIPIAKGLDFPSPIRFVVIEDTAGLDPAIGRLREMDGVSLSALDREPRRVDARVESSE